ncbi:MAG: cytochrome c553 [Paraglaciecola sp.]|jgi:cytochrome c553
MRTLLIRLGFAALSVGLMLLAYIYAMSTWMMQEKHLSHDRSFVVSPESDVQEGMRLAAIRGCTDCHGKTLAGGDFHGLHVPNLTTLVQQYSDNDLERSIRQAIRPDGTSVYSMTSNTYQHLSDIDLSHIISYLRSLDQIADNPDSFAPSFQYRIDIIRGARQPIVDSIHTKIPPILTPNDDAEKFGKYLAYSVCSECHGVNLKGYTGFSPNLLTTLAYQDLDFRILMTKGIGLGERDLGLMSISSRERFSLFSEDELSALFIYFHSEQFLQDMQ